MYTHDEANFPVPWTLLSVAGTLSFIAAGWARPRKVRLGGFQLPTPLFNALCSHPACTYTGRLSYPLYLWHWPLIVLFRHTCGMQPGGHKVGVIAATIGAAVLTHHGLEVQLGKWKPRKHWHIFAAMVPVLGFAELWLALLRTPLAGKLYLLGGRVDGVQSPTEYEFVLQPMSMQCPHCLSAGVTMGPDVHGWYPLRGHVPLSGKLTCNCVNPTDADPFPSQYTPPCFLCVNPTCQADALNTDFRRALTWRDFNPDAIKDNMFVVYADKCFLDPNQDPDVAATTEACLTPNRMWGASRTVFMLGDSHGAGLVPGLMTAIAGAATVKWVVVSWDILARASAGAYAGNGVAAAIDRSLRKHLRLGDAVVFMQAAYRFSELCFRSDCGEGGLGDTLHTGRPPTAMDAELHRAETEVYLRNLQALASPRGASLLLIGDWGLRPCNWNWDGFSERCNIPWAENKMLYLDKINPTYRRLAGTLPGVAFMDTNEVLCPDKGGPRGVCSNFAPGPVPGTVSGTAALTDDDHLSHSGSMYLWSHFCQYFALFGWPS